MIICVETATNVCSVALVDNGKLLGIKESTTEKSHASLLAVFIDRLLTENNIKSEDLDALAVSKGPGSYTGLRIGVSTAKGMCFAANIPLISVDTMEAMYHTFISNSEIYFRDKHLFCPMIDARRMEVYSSLLNSNGKLLSKVKAEIIDSKSYHNLLKHNTIHFFGSGAVKCKNTIVNKNAVFHSKFQISASGMITTAEKALKNKEFEDIAYFEPFYLKDYITSIPRKTFM